MEEDPALSGTFQPDWMKNEKNKQAEVIFY